MSDRCTYIRAYIGRCGKPADIPFRCEEHAAVLCCVCKKPATQECCYTGQFVCGAPLCNDCEEWTDTSKPYGSWGFMNHTHRRKIPSTTDLSQNAIGDEDGERP